MTHLSEIQLNRSALVSNARTLRSITPIGADFIAVVKGNAYGHGLKEVVETLDAEVDGFQVDDLEELSELRKYSKSRALVLGYVPKASLERALELDCELAIYDVERLPEIQRLAGNLHIRPKLHLKLDALLGRQGVLPSEMPVFIEKLREFPNLDVVALYGHFANIEDTTDLTHANAQVEMFETVHMSLIEAGIEHLGRHLSATSGLMAYEPTVQGNSLVRVGVGLYGLYPSASLARTQERLQLEPVLRWVTHLAQVKLLPAGHPVGYGLTFVTWRPTLIGIVPQGYSDGYDRGLSNASEVLIQGRRCPIIGRVAMNMFAVDLTQVPGAKAEDEVILLGEQGKDRITAEEMAARLGTINYEVVTRISPLLPRQLLY